MVKQAYETQEVIGTSTKSLAKAIEDGIEQAKKSASKPDWLEVMDIRGHLNDNKANHYQIHLKLGFYSSG